MGERSRPRPKPTKKSDGSADTSGKQRPDPGKPGTRLEKPNGEDAKGGDKKSGRKN